MTLHKGDMVIKGDITRDTIFNDTIQIFNLTGKLLSKKFFINGKQEGTEIDYYLNGRPRIITSFSDGLKNGYNAYFDSLTGLCFYKDFYYYNLPVGPVIHFDKTGAPKRYFFVSLQNETLLDIDYKSWKGIKDIFLDCIKFTSSIQKEFTSSIQKEDTNQQSIFLYLMNPPRMSFIYSILKRKENGKDEDLVQIITRIDDTKPFTQLVLPVLSSGENYVVGLKVFDSILNKQTLIYKDL